jgi:hypothetical protein
LSCLVEFSPRGFVCGNRFIIQETGRQMVEEHCKYGFAGGLSLYFFLLRSSIITLATVYYNRIVR